MSVPAHSLFKKNKYNKIRETMTPCVLTLGNQRTRAGPKNTLWIHEPQVKNAREHVNDPDLGISARPPPRGPRHADRFPLFIRRSPGPARARRVQTTHTAAATVTPPRSSASRVENMAGAGDDAGMDAVQKRLMFEDE
jgi:hypothetical protein